MTALVHRGFNGLMPYQDPELIPPNFAQKATNVRLINGDIDPARTATDVTDIVKTDPKTIYRFGQDLTDETKFWFTFLQDVDIVRGAVDQDTTERTYFTGVDYPRVTNAALATSTMTADYPAASLRLGVPAPVGMFTAEVLPKPMPGASDPNEATFAAVYLITYVTSLSEEGAGGLPSNLVTLKFSQSFVRLSNLPGAPTGNYDIRFKRIYRAANASVGSVFRLVATIPVGQTTYDDFKTDSELGSTYVTADFLPPPDGMMGLTTMANGIFCGFLDNTLYFSPVFIPYAYPVRFQLSTDAKIIGIKAFNQSLFVGTTANPFIITGLDPDALPQNKLSVNQALVSKRSMVAMLGGVLYASPDGVCRATEGNVEILTEKILTRNQWQAYKPESMHCHQVNNEYIVFYDTGTKKGHLIFDFTGKQALMTEGDAWYPAAYNDRFKDSLYVAEGKKIKKWDNGATLTSTWKSKKYRFPLERGFSRGHIQADGYPVTFNAYVDGALHYSVNVSSAKPFPIPAKHGRIWEVEVVTQFSVKSFTLAESQGEIE